MGVLMVLIVVVPLVATVGSSVMPRRVNEIATVIAGVLTFGLVLALVPATTAGTVMVGSVLRADSLSTVFLLATSFLYAITAVYTIGYLSHEAKLAAAAGGNAVKEYSRYSRRFYLGLNAFAWSMLCAPLANSMAVLWIAVEVTTVVSALLVALDNTEGAIEAAWKYVLIASTGLGIALLATVFLYYAGAQVFGESYDLSIDPLLRAARNLPQTPIQLAFVLAVVGFGTKVGLFPVHTWLPDAHAEAPTPVSVLLSGALLATSFYAILRFYQIAVSSLGTVFPQTTLLVFGVLSLLLAALFLFSQQNIKRMLAYSSIEHMGILAIGVSFGTPLALAGVLLHVLGHAAAKGSAFMGAGVLVRKFGTKDLAKIHGGLDVLPWSGPLFLLAIFALGALPPFGIFRSEFEIVAGGLGSPGNTGAVILIVLATLAFGGLTMSTTNALFKSGPTDGPITRGEPSVWMVVPVVAGLAALLLLGVYPPDTLLDLLRQGAFELQGGQ